jgi:ArsR family transcriptional regulator
MTQKEASRLFGLLGDESRLQIVLYLSEHGETCACRLLSFLSCTQPTLSHHLSFLSKAGLIHGRREGKWIHYSVDKKKLAELAEIIDEKEA